MNQPTDINLQRGIPTDQVARATAIYYAAFERKISPVLGTSADLAQAVLRQHMVPENALVALQQGEVMGLVGFHNNGKGLFDVTYGALVTAFGPLKGTGRALVGLLLSRSPAHDAFLLDGIAVHPDARGQGVGKALFNALFTLARSQGKAYIVLDVVNTNPRARALYERLGFVAVKTQSVPFLRSMGFTAVTTMHFDLSSREVAG